MGKEHRQERGILTDNDGCAVLLGVDAGVQERLGAVGKVLELKYTGRSVPEDRLGLADGLGEQFARLGSAVKPHPAGGDALLVSGGTDLVGTQTSVSSQDHMNRVAALTSAFLSNLSAVT